MQGYGEMLSEYLACQYRKILPSIQRIAAKTQLTRQYPLRKMLKAMAKILLLNYFQTIVLEHTLGKLEWKEDEIIEQYKEFVYNLINLADVKDLNMLRKLSLFLLLIGYTIKHQLNNQIQIFIKQITRHCKHFIRIHKLWLLKNCHFFQTLNLTDFYTFHSNKKQYNQMVDSILQISPSYNPYKKSKIKIEEHHPEPPLPILPAEQTYNIHLSMSMESREEYPELKQMKFEYRAMSIFESDQNIDEIREMPPIMQNWVVDNEGRSENGQNRESQKEELEEQQDRRLHTSDMLK